jgi:hypothetical protein
MPFWTQFFLLVIVLALPVQGVCDEGKGASESRINDKNNPRLADLNPYAWQGLPMEVVISDFQHSDGIYSSFICGEIIKRLALKPLDTLKALDQIDKDSRTYAFKICFHPEEGEGSNALESINEYKNRYPELVKEINQAAGDGNKQ